MFKLIKPIDEVSIIRDINTKQIIGYSILIVPEDVNKSIINVVIPEEYEDKVEVIKDKSGVVKELLVYEIQDLKNFLINLKQVIEVEMIDNIPVKEDSFEI
jgi:hypothetical protein